MNRRAEVFRGLANRFQAKTGSLRGLISHGDFGLVDFKQRVDELIRLLVLGLPLGGGQVCLVGVEVQVQSGAAESS